MQFFYNAQKVVTLIEYPRAMQLARANNFTLAIKNCNTLRLISQDNHGSPIVDYSQEGKYLCFCPYGFEHSIINTSPILYKGEFYDVKSNSYPLGNGYRFYIPIHRVFNSPDRESPFGRGDINPYAFAACDPINKSDPSGRSPIVINSAVAQNIMVNKGKLRWHVEYQKKSGRVLVIHRQDNSSPLSKIEFVKTLKHIVRSAKSEKPQGIQYLGSHQLSTTEYLEKSFFGEIANRYRMPVSYMQRQSPSSDLSSKYAKSADSFRPLRNASIFGTDDIYVPQLLLPKLKEIRQR